MSLRPSSDEGAAVTTYWQPRMLRPRVPLARDGDPREGVMSAQLPGSRGSPFPPPLAGFGQLPKLVRNRNDGLPDQRSAIQQIVRFNQAIERERGADVRLQRARGERSADVAH